MGRTVHSLSIMNNLTIARRLAIGFTLLVLLNAIAALVSIVTLRGIKREVSAIAEDALPGITLINRVQKDALLYGILTDRHVISNDDMEKRALDRECEELGLSIFRLVKAYEPLVGGDEERGLAERSEERRVGKECPSKCRSRWSPYH